MGGISSLYIFDAFMFSIEFFVAFMDTVNDSIIIEQARRDPINGLTFIQSVNMVSNGFGMLIGYPLSAYLVEHDHPVKIYFIFSFIMFITALCGSFLPDDIETNEHARMSLANN